MYVCVCTCVHGSLSFLAQKRLPVSAPAGRKATARSACLLQLQVELRRKRGWAAQEADAMSGMQEFSGSPLGSKYAVGF